MFSEKLRSLLKFGAFSTRYKDIYDMYYHCDKLNKKKLEACLDSYIFSEPGMRERSMTDVVKRITKVFQNKSYKSKVDQSDKRWIDASVDDVFRKILEYLNNL